MMMEGVEWPKPSSNSYENRYLYMTASRQVCLSHCLGQAGARSVYCIQKVNNGCCIINEFPGAESADTVLLQCVIAFFMYA